MPCNVEYQAARNVQEIGDCARKANMSTSIFTTWFDDRKLQPWARVIAIHIPSLARTRALKVTVWNGKEKEQGYEQQIKEKEAEEDEKEEEKTKKDGEIDSVRA